MKNNFMIFLVLFSFFKGFCQEKIELKGYVFSNIYKFNESQPFWLLANRQGFVGEETNFGVSAFAKAKLELSSASSIEFGIGGYYRDGASQEVQRSQLYVEYSNKWVQATVGAKDAEVVSQLSVTNENILISGNARAFPGVVIASPEYLRLYKNIFFEYGLGHYVLNDDRFVDNTRVHYKRLGLQFKTPSYGDFSFSVQHYAQWAGTHPTLGDFPDGFNDFVNVFLARKGGDNSDPGEQVNALGNHIGSFDFRYKRSFPMMNVEAYHLHLFEDGSGTAFKNFPDGVWGIKISPNTSKYVQQILYEYIDTRDQSGSAGRSGRDNYFSNKNYRSGWTYEGRTIGLPFIFLNPETGLGIINSRVQAHNLGALVKVNRFTISGKITRLKNLGIYATPLSPQEKKWLTYGNVLYKTKIGDFTLTGGADFSNVGKDVFGAGVGYRYVLD